MLCVVSTYICIANAPHSSLNVSNDADNKKIKTAKLMYCIASRLYSSRYTTDLHLGTWGDTLDSFKRPKRLFQSRKRDSFAFRRVSIVCKSADVCRLTPDRLLILLDILPEQNMASIILRAFPIQLLTKHSQLFSSYNWNRNALEILRDVFF